MIAAYSLSLELSTISALASNQFAKAHEKLGRNHPELGLKQEHVTKDFFSEIMGKDKIILEFQPFEVS